ncbi:GNAT family N-acetyltransferase [Aquibacillus koreensis]|uniref:GNAT family N-acetyltransferase n=1 Tax=Aquibacillus koreensis TaxID=279446 RepID=A0A9X3WQR5_9BACI|nr:GNAT family protein [Aquibacillus koreensis]MCT2534387.1 GNAT family N-acetyltransferase [Aquibacillus koreensis]MDC3421694.1 GNAT family N-acetyltransferase [Aquibacillus koreensis]
MLKKRELQDAPALYDLMKHPEVFPFVRHKAYSSDEFYFLTKQTIEAEENGELISRTIMDEYHQPIGTINLFDIEDRKGFLATWIGQPYFGKGYNKPAKDAFFDELFFRQGIEAIFIKIRKTNTRSLKAILKLPFVSLGNVLYPETFEKINVASLDEPIYELFVITREQYMIHTELEVVSNEGEAVV